MVDETRTDSDRTTNITTDRETIRTWVEESGAKPAYRTTDEGERELHVHHPDETDEEVEEIEWEEFDRRLDEDEMALVRHGDRSSDGSEQFELVDRTEAIERAALDDEEVEQALLEGETVETEIVETKVIERTVQETETIESEVIDSETIHDEVIDTDLVRREISDIHIGEAETGVAIVEDREAVGFDEEVEEIDIVEENRVITADVDETREATREIIDRKTVESRVVDHDVEGSETVESDTLEGRVDLEGVERTIVESDLLGGEVATDEVIEGEHLESEFTDEGTILTDLYQRRLVEDDIVDRKQLVFEVADEDIVDSELVESTLVETELIGSDALEEGAEVEGVMVEHEETEVTDEMTTGAEFDHPITDEDETVEGTSERMVEDDEMVGDETVVEDEAVSLDNDDVGKDVVDANDEQVGVITEVDEDDNLAYVDPHPGLAQRVKTRLGWEGHSEDAYTVEPDRIAAIDDDEIRLRNL